MINITSSIPTIGVYKITSPSGKIYIGQSTNIKYRWKMYYRLACKQQPKLYNSLLKYTPDKHQFEIIQECSSNQLNEYEIYYKQQELNKVDQNWNQVLFHNIYDNKPGLGNKKITYQFDLQGNFIKEWKSAKEAGYILDIQKHDITTCCRGKIKSAGGFRWSYNKDTYFDLTLRIGKTIIQYDKQGNIIQEWSSLKEAENKLNINKNNISLALTGKNNTAGGFIWKYKINHIYKQN
jgi:hypothetical protein